MSVPVYNFTDLHNEEFQTEILSRFQDIIKKNAYVEGYHHDLFQEEFAKMQGAKFCRLVANGTDALEIALLCHDIKHGDLVAVPTITFYASAEAILNIGAIPVFVDINPETGLICTESFKRIIHKHNIKAVMPVHIYGLPAPIEELTKICCENNIKIIEDAAQAHGAFLKNGPVGSSENLTTFSFYPTKNLSAFGDAGCILTQDEEMATKITNIRNHGRTNLNLLGRNSRCDNIQAAVLHLKLEKVEQYNQRRKEVASFYHRDLKELSNTGKAHILDDIYLETSSWHLYPIQLKSKKIRLELAEFLRLKRIGSIPYYEKSLPEEKTLGQYEGEWEHAKKFAGSTLCIPMHPFLKDEQLSKVTTAINRYFEQK